MNKIFLSHSPAGAPMAKLVCQSLTASGNSVLLAVRGTICTGPERGRHRELLGDCDICLLMLMPGEARADTWVGYEIAMAANASKRAIVVPVGAAQSEIDMIPAGFVEFWSLAAADTGYHFIPMQNAEAAAPPPLPMSAPARARQVA